MPKLTHEMVEETPEKIHGERAAAVATSPSKGNPRRI